MNDIQFNCPHCGQSLAVDAAGAGTAVACPKCGQTISVPPFTQSSRGKGRLPAVLVVIVLLLLVAGLLFWHWHGRPGVTLINALPDNLATNLVLYYNFDSEPTDGKVLDLSGHGNNGDAVNVQWTAKGHHGGALVLSPADSHIRVPNNDSLNPTEFTLYAWIKTSRTDRYWRRIFDKGLFHNGFDLTVAGDWKKWNPPSKYRGFVEFETLKTGEAASRDSLADGQWHQIAATYDGQYKQLFVDGQFQHKTLSHHVSLGNDFDLVIGGFTDPDPQNDDPHASFDGSLDEVMMFNRALSSNEVQTLYHSQVTAVGQ